MKLSTWDDCQRDWTATHVGAVFRKEYVGWISNIRLLNWSKIYTFYTHPLLTFIYHIHSLMLSSITSRAGARCLEYLTPGARPGVEFHTWNLGIPLIFPSTHPVCPTTLSNHHKTPCLRKLCSDGFELTRLKPNELRSLWKGFGLRYINNNKVIPKKCLIHSV